VISSSQGLYLYTNTEKRTHTLTLNIHALSGIRTHDPGFRASEGSACLRTLGYRDRHCYLILNVIESGKQKEKELIFLWLLENRFPKFDDLTFVTSVLVLIRI
jgi:hypothetical protein